MGRQGGLLLASWGEEEFQPGVRESCEGVGLDDC